MLEGWNVRMNILTIQQSEAFKHSNKSYGLLPVQKKHTGYRL
jgi:hypothetical protein